MAGDKLRIGGHELVQFGGKPRRRRAMAGGDSGRRGGQAAKAGKDGPLIAPLKRAAALGANAGAPPRAGPALRRASKRHG